MLQDRLFELTKSINNCYYRSGEEDLSSDEAMILFHKYLLKIQNGSRKVIVIGNGGSSGIASHFANDLLRSLEIPAITFVDSNLITCISNDYGYEKVYSKPLEIIGNDGDLLIAISSSGQSINIVNAAESAKKKGMNVITLSGFMKENPLKILGDLNIWIDKKDYGIVEMAHFVILHTVVDLFSKNISKFLPERELLNV